MGHAWVDGRRDDADMKRLAARLRDSGIRDVYVHVGPLADDGTLDPALHPEVDSFLEDSRAALPDVVRVSAWLGNIVGPDALDLTDPATRRAVVASADQVLRLGFDGVHFDMEPVPDGNKDYLHLLERTQAVTERRGAVLSVAAEPIEPLRYAADALEIVTARSLYWSPGYLNDVARRVDQVAIMTYDSGMPLESLYGGYVARQTRIALDTVPADVDLLIGLPAYHEPTIVHRPRAEIMAAGVRGVRLAYSERPRERFGVAIYVDFTATQDDWQGYQQGWAGRTGR